MPNKSYIKGVRFERKIVNDAKRYGLIAFRSAGSHSPIDVITIDKDNKEIVLFQCKAKSYLSKKEIEKYHALNLNGIYKVYFNF